MTMRGKQRSAAKLFYDRKFKVNPLTSAETKQVRAEARIHSSLGRRSGRPPVESAYYRGMGAGMDDIADEYGKNPPQSKLAFRIEQLKTDIESAKIGLENAKLRGDKLRENLFQLKLDRLENELMKIEMGLARENPTEKFVIYYDEKGNARSVYSEAEAKRWIKRGFKMHFDFPGRSLPSVTKKFRALQSAEYSGNPANWERCGYCLTDVPAPAFSPGPEHLVGCPRYRTNAKRGRKTIGRKNPCDKANPAKIKIYEKVLEIIAMKGAGHKCDAACRAAGHIYRHKFSKAYNAGVFGAKDGSLTIK